jgi:nucleoside-diphosphate-sugar epimerase
VDYRRVDLSTDILREPGAVLVHLAWRMKRADAREQSGSAAEFMRLLEEGGWAGVVGMGSAEEYGNLEGCLREEQAPGPCLSAYGAAKQAACNALRNWVRSPGRRAVWLRPFVVYGPGQGGDMVIPYAVQCARDRRPAKLSAGLQFRDFVHVDDVADGIARAALVLPDLEDGRLAVCNLGRGEPVRLRDVLDRIADQMEAQKLFRFGKQPMRPGEPQKQYADVSAAAVLFGWRAAISWKMGIDALCKEQEKDNHG